MSRPWVIWLVLGGCAAVILGMFSWMTVHALKSEQDRIEMEAQAGVSERMRLSLARMDTIGAELLVVENQRPPFHYESFYSPEDVMTNTLQSVAKGIVLQPSPLLLEDRNLVKMHFEVSSMGKIHSPQCPLGNHRELAVQAGLSEETIKESEGLLDEIRELVPRNEPLASMMCIAAHASNWGGSPVQQEIQQKANDWMAKEGADNYLQALPQKLAYQQNLATREKLERAGVINKAIDAANSRSNPKKLAVDNGQSEPNPEDQVDVDALLNPPPDGQQLEGTAASLESELQAIQTQQEMSARMVDLSEEIIGVAPLLPIWVGEELLLIREVKMSRSTRYQGLWLDREKLEAEFMAQIPEDLACTQLLAVKSGEDQVEDPYVLASLPWKLVQGPIGEVSLEGMTPLRSTLLAGWIAALLALVALYFLLQGVMRLSERRAAFVSSVTHELRTPLTTFRLYSEMLAEGMISDEVKREEYLRTMLSESERLNHLVENVLAYSRIERGNARSKQQLISVHSLVGQLRPILQRRVDQEGAALSVEIEDNAGEIETDVTAIEQILFNLIDNACKYGLPESGHGHVTLRARRTKRGVEFQVSDEGRGVASGDRKRLFRAFHKSALDAAHDKPGVGLGLALCRRLARALGGDLTLDAKAGKGASFRLQVPG